MIPKGIWLDYELIRTNNVGFTEAQWAINHLVYKQHITHIQQTKGIKFPVNEVDYG